MDRAEIRRALGWSLVAALTIAAITAIGALATGDFDDTEWRVLATSFAFALLSATAAAGSTARLRQSENLQTLGGATFVASVATFVLLVAGLWTDLIDEEGLWRTFGCFAILTAAGSHACLVLLARKSDDGEVIGLLVTVSLATAAIDAVVGLVPVSGLVGAEVDEGFGQVVAVLVVILLFTTLMPPLLRRLQRGEAKRDPMANGFAGEVLEICDRIDELGRGPGLRTPEIRRETERLRRIARRASA